MLINGSEYPDPILGDGRKVGAATITTQALTGKIRTYVRTYNDTYTLTFDKLTTAKYLSLLQMLDSIITISGIINGTFLCLTNPVEGKEGKHYWSLTLTLRKQE